MKKVLAVCLTLLIIVSNSVSVFASTVGTINETPELIIKSDINSQQNHDTNIYLSIRSEKEEAPECQSIIKSINQNQPELNTMNDIISAKLVDMKELPISVASNFVNINLYQNTWPQIKTYYVAIDYKVNKESRWFYNGVNYRLIVLALENNHWNIVEEAMAPVGNLVKSGVAFGTKEEGTAQTLLTNRLKIGKFTNLQGELIEDNADKPDQATLELRRFNREKAENIISSQSKSIIAPDGIIPTFTPPAYIRVYRTATKTVEKVDFDTYIKHVLPFEWVNGWPPESLKTGAIAVKMYAWYYSLHPHSSSYDVKDDTSDQVYKSIDISAYPTCTNAVDAVNGYLITDQDYNIFIAHYWAGSYGPGRIGPSSCPTDGWVWQNGSKYWADQSCGWYWICCYAYNNSDTTNYKQINMYTY